MFLFQESQTACLEIFRIETVKTFVVFIVSHMRKTKQFPDEFFVPACRKRRSRNNSAYRVVDGFFKLAVRYDTGYETSFFRFPCIENTAFQQYFHKHVFSGQCNQWFKFRIGHDETQIFDRRTETGRFIANPEITGRCDFQTGADTNAFDMSAAPA